MPTTAMTERKLFVELTPTVGELYERHMDTCKPWYPHEYVPYSRGEDFGKGYRWDPQESEIQEEAVRAALHVNLLTEDNLPYYYQTIDRMFGREGAWRDWSGRWTAEEARHSIALREFLLVTRAIDPVALEEGRMQQMSKGEVPQPESPIDGLVYVTFQELATRVAHGRTGRKLKDEAGQELLSRVATDENYHFLFYRDLTAAALQRAPELVLPAIERQVTNFEMPGTGIEGFKSFAKLIALSGILGFKEMLEQVFKPVLKSWNVERFRGSSAEANTALDIIDERLVRLGKVATREEAARKKYNARLAA